MSKTPHISMPDSSERDWTEDFQHENGNYSCKCCECGLYFYGHKRRPICKVCANKEPDWNTISKKQPPEDKKGNIAWHGAWLEGEMVGYARCMVKKVSALKLELQEKDKEIERLKTKLNKREQHFKELQIVYDSKSLREQGTEWREGYFDGLRSNLLHMELKDDELASLQSSHKELYKILLVCFPDETRLNPERKQALANAKQLLKP